jgi:aldoxime dehydratase
MTKAVDIGKKPVALSPSPRFMPPEWNPPAPAWSASFAQRSAPVVMAYFGAQIESPALRDRGGRMREFFGGCDGPANYELAKYVDRRGFQTLLVSAYWTDPTGYQTWEQRSGFATWWNDPCRLNERYGYFREILSVSPERFETIFSRNCLVGIANTGGCPVVGPIREHNYWGSMRDRILASTHSELGSEYGESLPRLGSRSSLNQRLRVSVPENLAVIRSGQDWSDCVGLELDQYKGSLQPTLLEGMSYLREHPRETGCCEMRFADETNHDGLLLKRTFGLGYFLTLGHLEKWASTHPTHLAIFSKFLTMVAEHGRDLKLKLWHEVSVLPSSDQLFEYVNCHPETGLLPYFPSKQISS